MSDLEQRGASGGRSRRQVLRAVGGLGAGVLTGCLGAAGRAESVTVLAAGSLQHALEVGLKPAVDVPLRIETRGSATAARLVAEGKRDPDILAVADTALFSSPLSVPWYVAFASNAVVLAYDPDSDGGRAIAAADPERWYEPLVEGSVSLGRTDPDQDPLGYRTLFAFDLASRFYDGLDDFREQVLGREQIYPETGLLSQFETGAIDAAVAYRNMAVERGYDFHALPPQIDLSDPAYAESWYGTVAHELPSGRVVRGDVIEYGATARSDDRKTRAVFGPLTTGSSLDDAGFVRRGGFPRATGEVPEWTTDGIDGATATETARRTVR